jgi:hypothetical protein
MATSKNNINTSFPAFDANREPEFNNPTTFQPRSEETESSNPSQDTNETKNKIINLLIDNVRKENYLPVLFVGSPGSGKTQVFTSLMTYFRKSGGEQRNPNHASVTLGPPLIDTDTGYGKEAWKRAESHFNRMISGAVSGKADAATTISDPFIIPVHLEAIINGNPVLQKFAFIETNGEWFQTNTNQVDGEFYKPLKPEILALFKKFGDNSGIAIIYTAPSDVSNDNTQQLSNKVFQEKLKEADESIHAGLSKYIESRSRRDKDKHIFLLTKWDSVKNLKGFSDRINLNEFDQHKILTMTVDDSFHLASHIASELFPNSFNLFNGASVAAKDEQRVFMPYSSGLFDGNSISTVVSDNKQDRYVKSLWNVLMETAGHSNPIFPPEKRAEVPFYKKILDSIFG